MNRWIDGWIGEGKERRREGGRKAGRWEDQTD